MDLRHIIVTYILLLGGQKACPETTGYLIPTLIDYDKLFHDFKLLEKNLLNVQIEYVIWLLRDGALPGEFRRI